MEYLHVRSIETYHPKYKDRQLTWCKTYFSMINSDPEFELLDEIDKWRFICFVMLELQLKKEIPLDSKYLTRKGFDLKKRPISKTLQMLHTLIEVRNETVPYIILEEDKEEESVTPPSSLLIEAIVDDLNVVLGTNYRSDAKATVKLITERSKKHTLEDFKIVHRKKYKAWKDDPKMVQYLRPETLYSDKFEGYLNEKEVKKSGYRII